MKIEDINGLSDLLKMGSTLEQITQSLKEGLSDEDKKKFDEELEKSGYSKTIKDVNNLQSQFKNSIK